jgi:hypothetical protein
MRLIIIIVVTLILGSLGYLARARSKDLSNIFYGVGGVFFILLLAVLFVGSPE